MLLRTLIIFALAIFLSCNAFAMQADSSVSITSQKDDYQFGYNAQTGNVEIKQKLSTTYASANYAVNYPITEVYNKHISINDVSCKVDGHTPKGFKPVYTYYGEEDVFYSDAKVCYFSMYLPKKGSLGQVTFTETLDDPRYFTNIYFANSAATQKMEVNILIPRWMKVEIKELNFNAFDITKTTKYISEGDADLITYTINNIPAMEQEDNSPGPTYIYPHLLVLCKSASPVAGKQITYFSTLADQYAWYRELVKNIGTDETIIAAKSKELTTGLTTDIDKIKAIYYYVQNNIRYIAFEDGMAGFKPEKADEVLRKKYGDCKGMANLTKEMLVAAGFNARLCWLGTNHIAYDYQTPSMAVDNHMICALLYNGKTYYLDATETYIGFDEYAERIQGRQILMEDGDKYLLNRVPVTPASQNADIETDELAVNGNNLAGKVGHVWKGEAKEEVLAGLNSIKHENEDKAMIQYLSSNNTDYAINNLQFSSADSRDKDMTASYDLDFKNAVNTFSKTIYIDLDTKKELSTDVIKLPERKYDYWFPYKTDVDLTTQLAIPAGYKAGNIPAKLDVVNPDYEFHISYTVLPGKIVYKKNLIIKNTSLAKSKFAQWNLDIDRLNKTYTQNITLTPITE